MKGNAPSRQRCESTVGHPLPMEGKVAGGVDIHGLLGSNLEGA